MVTGAGSGCLSTLAALGLGATNLAGQEVVGYGKLATVEKKVYFYFILS